MRIDPILAELRRDPAPQQRAQAALEAIRENWRQAPCTAALFQELARYGAGAAVADCPLLTSALSELAFAHEFVGALISPLMEQLAEHPLGHVPFRHQYAQGLAVMQLAEAGSASLSLVCYEARSQGSPAKTVCFAGGERHELCLAGAADARIFELLREEGDRGDLHCEHRRLEAGDTLSFGGPCHTKIVDQPLRRMVMLRLSRSAPATSPAREYRIGDGALVHRASSDRAESRSEMAAAVLGAMQRADAATALAEIARTDVSDHLRWQVLCQALALDTACGFAALSEIAGDDADALAAPAGALRASLVERYPALLAWNQPCLA